MSAAAAMTTDAGLASETVPARNWLAVLGGVLGAFMAVLNIQVVNASLADIQGALGASLDEGSWISTSYLIAEIIVIPLTGWLSQVFGIKRYLLANVVLFVAFMIACAFAWNLQAMIAFRALGRVLWRRAHPDCLYDHPDAAAAGKADDRFCPVWPDRDPGAVGRADAWRLALRQLRLAIHFLHPDRARRPDVPHVGARPRQRAHTAWPASQRGLARHCLDGGRPGSAGVDA